MRDVPSEERPPPDRDEVLATLRAVLEDEPAVEAAWLFGSVARRETWARSDVDVAMLPREPIPLDRELELRARLARALGLPDVDLVVLAPGRVRPALRYEATDGIRVLARDEERADRYELRAVLEYLDTQHWRDTQHRLLVEAVAALRRRVK